MGYVIWASVSELSLHGSTMEFLACWQLGRELSWPPHKRGGLVVREIVEVRS